MIFGACLVLVFVWRLHGRDPEGPVPSGPDLRSLMQSVPEWPAPDDGPWTLDLPRDHAAHQDARAELWTISGRLRGSGDGGPVRGFQLVITRIGLVHGRTDRESVWAANEVYGGQISLIREGDPVATTDVRLSRAALGLAGSETDPPRVWVRDWSIGFEERGLMLRAGSSDIRLNLLLEPKKGALDGVALDLLPAGPDGSAPRLYVLPRLRVQGRIMVDGKDLEVEGEAIMDHAWGGLNGGAGGTLNLNRFALLLDDGREVLCLELRRAGGGGRPVPACALVLGDGRVQGFRRRELSLVATASSRSPRTGADYPVAWRLEIPLLDLALEMEPVARDQELEAGAPLWSGAVRVSGGQGGTPVSGSGRIQSMAAPVAGSDGPPALLD